ncbi:protein IQ-DOMAIN 32-like [Andrographis paniculata]|uniref:protein IQ-DOMAIN 32-like n=1 Tax=Andrographis paniculata TaxID=175694 RepID=UPI0021E7BD6F|nr:protein IQ-DOMAIN 32-like [Andrographis paniculata]
MAKSAVSCLRIIACGSDSVNDDRESPPEIKSSSSGRRGWSFRKRSARHRVLNNSVVSEIPSFENKEHHESTAPNFQVQPNSTLLDNTSAVQGTHEMNELQPKTVVTTVDGDSIIVIQTAIRGYLAQQVLLKQKHAIKLQAVVRGHLVRRHAVGTLRCIQAISRMQTLVRLRWSRLLEEESSTSEHQNGDSGQNSLNPVILKSRGTAEANSMCTTNDDNNNTSIEKILSNKFARQLMESTPRTQSLGIRCDPLKSDTAWKWLERWMSVSSKVAGEPPPETEDSEGSGRISGQSEHNDSDKFELRSSVMSSLSHPKLPIIDESAGYDIKQQPDPTGMKEKVLVSDVDTETLPENAAEQECRPDRGHLVAELPETEKFSLQGSSPTSCAAPSSKHDELSSDTTSSNKIAPASNNSAIQVSRPECGTELSISSTLDSTDVPKSGAIALPQESEVLDTTDHPGGRGRSGHVIDDSNSYTLGTELSYPSTNELESHKGTESVSGECTNPLVAADSPQFKKLESDQHKLHENTKSDVRPSVHKSSPETSPISLKRVTESPVTPSGQMSPEPEKSTGSSNKQEAKHRNTRGAIPKDRKTGMRRNSFGSAMPARDEHQDRRHSSGSISRPSYMQATESARAKAIANGSPRSSPDVQHNNIHIKSRSSPPSTNEKQGSPNVRRSLSLAQQNSKAIGAQSPQERKWRV